MSTALDAVLDRLGPYQLRPNGKNRWRARCPAHGGSNPSTLSVGIGDNNGVLLRCWVGCSVDEIARALGLELGDLFPCEPHYSREPHHSAKPKRIGMLSAAQALEVIGFECTLIFTAAFNLANGHALTADDLQRLGAAAKRVQSIIAEVRA